MCTGPHLTSTSANLGLEKFENLALFDVHRHTFKTNLQTHNKNGIHKPNEKFMLDNKNIYQQ